MEEILKLLPVLAVAIAMNTATGVYYNVGTNKMQFKLSMLLSGIVKAVIIGFCFVGSAYCFEVTDLATVGVTPQLIMNAAITLYMGKAMASFMKILGVDIKTTKK